MGASSGRRRDSHPRCRTRLSQIAQIAAVRAVEYAVVQELTHNAYILYVVRTSHLDHRQLG